VKFTLQLQYLQQNKANFNLQIVTKTEVLQQTMKDDEKLAKLLITERKINVSKTISIILKKEPET
jgi:RNA:NAD 2'-phosphotransferase (TPT1/KptA family)